MSLTIGQLKDLEQRTEKKYKKFKEKTNELPKWALNYQEASKSVNFNITNERLEKLNDDVISLETNMVNALQKSQNATKKTINPSKVINSLVYILKHTVYEAGRIPHFDISLDVMSLELEKMGIDYNEADILEQFPELSNMSLSEGIKNNNLGSVALIALEVKKQFSHAGANIDYEPFMLKYFTFDNGEDMYSFIRTTTENKGVTRESVVKERLEEKEEEKRKADIERQRLMNKSDILSGIEEDHYKEMASKIR